MAGEMTQGASKRHTVYHFSHNHPLTEVNVVGSYTCNGCKLYGDGKTYRCSDCDYNLHEYCATCPRILRNTRHGPDHELSLINGPTHMNMTEHLCYVCRVYIQGMFYKCKHCSFESHPLCTHDPMHFQPPDATLMKQRSFHDQAGQLSWPHHYGQGTPPLWPHQYGQGNPPSWPHHYAQGYPPSWPHHYGQGDPYGYAHMNPFWPYYYGGYHHPHQHHPPYMNIDSPNPDTPVKKGLVAGTAKAIVAVTAAVAANLIAGTIESMW